VEVDIVAAEGGKGGLDPIHQFEVHPLGGGDLSIFGVNIFPSNATLWMFIVVTAVAIVFLYGSRLKALVPGRLQSLGEIGYEFVENTLVSVTGREGMVFFPLVFTLFMFVFASNMLGMIPGSFTVTSQLIITASLSLLVMAVVVIAGFARHGSHFLGLFVPSGVPGWLLPFMVLIEVISFFLRPISLSLRLFGNMLAGHIALKVFGGFVAMLLGAGAWGVISPFPMLLAVALTALEFLVAFLQAYVFTILTCVYLNDSLHPGH
jgi:F-type H+-transporting ATPase subunit a